MLPSCVSRQRVRARGACAAPLSPHARPRCIGVGLSHQSVAEAIDCAVCILISCAQARAAGHEHVTAKGGGAQGATRAALHALQAWRLAGRGAIA